jgi:hypothetical protein
VLVARAGLADIDYAALKSDMLAALRRLGLIRAEEAAKPAGRRDTGPAAA